jgi:two-component system OmpR family response regulator
VACVATGRVLIIEADEWVGTVLARFLKQAGHEVHMASDAGEGLARALELTPDCIICDVDLPDIDGFWVARRLRAERPDVAMVPFLFLTDLQDPDERLQSLLAGADLYITTPVRHEEVVAQVGALAGMVHRLRQREAADQSSFGAEGPSFQGDISMLSVPTMLSMLEMERRTGSVKVTSDGKEAVFGMAESEIRRVTLGGREREPVEAMREVLRWKQGSFAYTPGGSPGSAGRGHSVGALLLEAMKREDESGH